MGRGGWESRVTTLLAQGGYHGREGGGDGHWGRQRHITARICQHFHLQQTIGEVVQISAGCKQAPFICLLLQLKKTTKNNNSSSAKFVHETICTTSLATEAVNWVSDFCMELHVARPHTETNNISQNLIYTVTLLFAKHTSVLPCGSPRF